VCWPTCTDRRVLRLCVHIAMDSSVLPLPGVLPLPSGATGLSLGLAVEGPLFTPSANELPTKGQLFLPAMPLGNMEGVKDTPLPPTRVRTLREKREPFSEAEDRVIIELHKKFGCKWVKMGEMLPGRSDVDVKNRWNSSMRRVYRNIYNTDVEKRRRAAMLEPLYCYCLLTRETIGISAAERRFRDRLYNARAVREANQGSLSDRPPKLVKKKRKKRGSPVDKKLLMEGGDGVAQALHALAASNGTAVESLNVKRFKASVTPPLDGVLLQPLPLPLPPPPPPLLPLPLPLPQSTINNTPSSSSTPSVNTDPKSVIPSMPQSTSQAQTEQLLQQQIMMYQMQMQMQMRMQMQIDQLRAQIGGNSADGAAASLPQPNPTPFQYASIAPVPATTNVLQQSLQTMYPSPMGALTGGHSSYFPPSLNIGQMNPLPVGNIGPSYVPQPQTGWEQTPTPATLNATPATLNATPATLNATPATLNATPATLIATPATLIATPATLNATPVTMNATPVTMNTAPLQQPHLGSPQE
jgi:hypothetical protein